MRLRNILIVVEDIEKSKKFYFFARKKQRFHTASHSCLYSMYLQNYIQLKPTSSSKPITALVMPSTY